MIFVERKCCIFIFKVGYTFLQGTPIVLKLNMNMRNSLTRQLFHDEGPCHCKPMDWFLYDLRQERVKDQCSEAATRGIP